jgi:hypothetical protein
MGMATKGTRGTKGFSPPSFVLFVPFVAISFWSLCLPERFGADIFAQQIFPKKTTELRS